MAFLTTYFVRSINRITVSGKMFLCIYSYKMIDMYIHTYIHTYIHA